MRAKVKNSYRWPSIRACGGVEFVKAEFHLVPAGREAEARACSILEIEGADQPAEMVIPAGAHAEVMEVKARQGKGKR